MKYIVVLALILANANSFAQSFLTPEKLLEFKRLSSATVSPDGNYLVYSQSTVDVASNKSNADIYLIDLKTNTTKQLTNTPYSEYDPQWTTNNQLYFISTEGGTADVYKMDVNGNNKQQVTNLKNIGSFKISPDEKSLLTLQNVKIRNTINEVYTDLPKSNARVEDDLMYRHWASWDNYHVEHLFYHQLSGKLIETEGIDLMKGEAFPSSIPPFGGMGSISFSNDNKSVVLALKKLRGKQSATSTNTEIYKIDLATFQQICITCTGNFKGYDLHPSMSTKGDLAWLSMENDGFESGKNDLLLQTANGQIKNLTKTFDITVSDFVWNYDGTRIYMLVPTNGTVQIFDYKILTGELQQLTAGRHDYVSLSTVGTKIYAGKQNMLSPVELFELSIRYTKKGNVVDEKQLTTVNKELLASLNKPTVQQLNVKTSDDKDMLVWMVLPPDFDSTKKYPTLLYCQGGPQSQVSQFFSYRWNLMLMASQGYIVIAPNRRGLPGFGKEWNDAISKDWGGQPMKDYLAAIDEAAKLPFVDETRLGAVGASYGGYSVYMLAGIHQNRFKTFISHCGLFNLESWYGTTEELFFANWEIGGPYWSEENKDAYLKNSPHRYVQNWNTPILVIHGGMDFRVPESEGMQAFQAAQLKGLKSRFLHFPTEGHWVSSAQNSLVWQREFFKWLKETL